MTRVLGPDSIQIVERSQLPLVADPAPTVTENTGTTRTVVLRPEARHTIRNLDLTTEWESGGWLVGWQDGDELIVETVYAAKGSDHRGEKNAVSLDGEWFAVVDEKAQRCGWRVVGDWHSHPQSDTEPSARDEHGWLQQTVRLRQVYVGIILCPDPYADTDRFARTQRQGHIATQTGTLRPVASTSSWTATDGHDEAAKRRALPKNYGQVTRNRSTIAANSPASGCPLPLRSLHVWCVNVNTVTFPITCPSAA